MLILLKIPKTQIHLGPATNSEKPPQNNSPRQFPSLGQQLHTLPTVQFAKFPLPSSYSAREVKASAAAKGHLPQKKGGREVRSELASTRQIAPPERERVRPLMHRCRRASHSPSLLQRDREKFRAVRESNPFDRPSAEVTETYRQDYLLFPGNYNDYHLIRGLLFVPKMRLVESPANLLLVC